MQAPGSFRSFKSGWRSADVLGVTPRRILRQLVDADATARPKIAEALIWVAIWVCGLSGLVVTAYALYVGEPNLLVPAATTTLTGVVGLVQRARSRPRPLVLLVCASSSLAASVPLVDTLGHLVTLPALVLAGSIGALALSRRVAVWFVVWCGLLEVASLPWVLTDMTVAQFLLGAILLVAVQTAGWRFVSLAGDLLVREEESHRLIHRNSPVAILEEDYSQAAARLEAWRAGGIEDVRSYLADHPTQLRELISSIRIRSANEAALQMIGAESIEELEQSFAKVERQDHELGAYLEQFVAISEGRSEVATDLNGVSLEGEKLEVVLHWSVPTVRGRRDLSRVIVTLSDIAPRKVVEQRLTELLQSNQRLLSVEHALAQCSRALLLGSGEEALEVALEALRNAVDADRAYLSMNNEDPRAGASFHVLKSAVRDGQADTWLGETFPWSRYWMMRDELMAGRPFRTSPDDSPDRALIVSALAVPVFLEGQWVAAVGFVDLDPDRVWDDEAVRMLEVAAPMLGTFWERETTRQRLEELVRSKDRFVASVSHELRTPLAAVLGFAEELREKSSSFKAGELTEMLELIADQSQEMADMVEDLLVSARADIGTVSIRPQSVFLRAQAETVLTSLGSTVTKDIRVTGGRGKVWADPARTRQIIRNLITNAMRYGGDEVVVEATEGDSQTRLTVIDNGPGVDPEMWEPIFEPYQRAHETDTQPASIGLGLTVSRQLARMMGGDLTYTCDDRGSVFTLILPSEAPTSQAANVTDSELIPAR